MTDPAGPTHRRRTNLRDGPFDISDDRRYLDCLLPIIYKRLVSCQAV